MALKLVTAPPGTGKTLLLIKMIFEFLKEGRRVYANIDQLKIAEVLTIPSDADWRDLPDGSVVIYDEAQEHPSFSKRDLTRFEEFIEPAQLDNENITTYKERIRQAKKSYDIRKKAYLTHIEDVAASLQVHRHFGFDIILATQSGSLLNSLTLDIVGEHYHLTRPFGFKRNVLTFWRHYVSNPHSSVGIAEWKKQISFNKNYFHLYRSANVHTHKASVPIKYVLFFFVVLALLSSPFFLMKNNNAIKLGTGEKNMTDVVMSGEMPKNIDQISAPIQNKEIDQQQAEREKQLEENREKYQQIQSQQEEQEISGCVMFNGKYTAIDEYARPIHSKAHLCKAVIQDADRNAMKKPTARQFTQYNTYSQEANDNLETARNEQQQTQDIQQQRVAANDKL